MCCSEHKGRYSEEWGTQSSIFFPTMEVNGAPKQPDYKLSSKYLPLCSTEQRNSYRFGSTWGWVNDYRIFIFGWTIPLSSCTLAMGSNSVQCHVQDKHTEVHTQFRESCCETHDWSKTSRYSCIWVMTALQKIRAAAFLRRCTGEERNHILYQNSEWWLDKDSHVPYRQTAASEMSHTSNNRSKDHSTIRATHYPASLTISFTTIQPPVRRCVC